MSIRSLDQVPRDVMERGHYEQLALIASRTKEAALIAAMLQMYNKNFNMKRFMDTVSGYKAG